MPRAPRIEFPGAIYHVMNRGDRLEAIFWDDEDREIFMKTLAETCRSSGWVIHSFVLMKNHYHLLMETERETLVKGMQYLNSTYTRRYNVRHKCFGHLFAGRYKALLVDGEARGYFLTVSDYIHMNPIRAKRYKEVKALLGDKWSSAGWLAGVRRRRPEWLRWERVYGELGHGRWSRRSRREFREYLERRMLEVEEAKEINQKIRRGWCLGSERFKNEMKGILEAKEKGEQESDSWSGVAVEEMEQDKARKALAEGLECLNGPRKGGMTSIEKYLLGRWVRSRTKVGVKWLAKELGMNAGTLSHGIWKVGERMKTDRNLKKTWLRIKN